MHRGESRPHRGYEPAKLEADQGDEDLKRVTLHSGGRQACWAPHGGRSAQPPDTVVPHAALLYGADGTAFVYTVRRPPIRRAKVRVRRRGRRRVVVRAARAGIEVVTVGAAEVYGSEFEVGH